MRRLVNEDELDKVLLNFGFERVTMSNYAWDQQIKIVSSAECIVAPHGMGLTLLAFNLNKPIVVEIFNPEIGSEAYALLSKAYGNKYYRIIGTEVDSRKHDFHADPLKIISVLELEQIFQL